MVRMIAMFTVMVGSSLKSWVGEPAKHNLNFNVEFFFAHTKGLCIIYVDIYMYSDFVTKLEQLHPKV